MKNSTRAALKTAVSVVLGLCAAVPVFLSTSGLPSGAGAGATALAVATAVAKFAHLAEDELD